MKCQQGVKVVPATAEWEKGEGGGWTILIRLERVRRQMKRAGCAIGKLQMRGFGEGIQEKKNEVK